MDHPVLKRQTGPLALAWLLAVMTPLQAQAQGLPAAPTSFVQLQLANCGTTVLRGQGTLDGDCTFNFGPDAQGTTSANGSNLGGILRGNTSASVAQVNLVATSTSHWDDRFTYLGGAVPASAVFSFQLFGTFNASVSGQSTAAINEALYRAFVRPFGSWGSAASFASGTLNPRQVLQTAGPALNEFIPVLQALTLPVSLAGIEVGDSLDLTSTLSMSSQASAARGGIADAEGIFSNSAGLVDLRFFDALGADITPQVQYSWQWGTQFLAPVPEPHSGWLALGGLAVLARLVRARLRRVA